MPSFKDTCMMLTLLQYVLLNFNLAKSAAKWLILTYIASIALDFQRVGDDHFVILHTNMFPISLSIRVHPVLTLSDTGLVPAIAEQIKIKFLQTLLKLHIG